MSATEERREEEEARRHDTLLKLLDEVERQIREGRADARLLEAVRRLRPEDAVELVYWLDDKAEEMEEEGEDLGEEFWRALSKVEEAALPRIAEYVRQVAGVDVPLRARRGWTDRVIEALRGLPAAESFEEAMRRGMDEFLYALGDRYASGVVSWERFRGILRHVPVRLLLYRRNGSPRYLDFVVAAASVPGSYLSVRVSGDDKREDIDIDGILLPIQGGADDAVWNLLQEAESLPDDLMFVEVKGKQYIWLWWD